MDISLEKKGIEADLGTRHMEKIYQKEIQRLIEARPDLEPFQREIERRLLQAGNSENRMAVLGIMMEAKLKELQHKLSCLADLAKSFT